MRPAAVPSRTKKLVTVAKVAGAFVALAGIAYWQITRGPLPFSQARWGEGASMWNDPRHRRHRVADWFVYTRSLVGSTEPEIISLLGEPTDRYEQWPLAYNLGPERGWIPMDNEVLAFELGPDGRVTKTLIFQN
jgi:hypothetical protein